MILNTVKKFLDTEKKFLSLYHPKLTHQRLKFILKKDPHSINFNEKTCAHFCMKSPLQMPTYDHFSIKYQIMYFYFIKHTTMFFLQNGRKDSSPIPLLHWYTSYLESSSGLFHWLFAFFTVNTTDCQFWLS